MAEEIGSVSVAIVGDYSQLQADLDRAKQVAADAGGEIAEALSEGAAGADALSGAISGAATAAGSFEAQIQALVDSGSTLAEALAQVQGDMEAVAEGVSGVGTNAAQAAEQLSLFDEALDVPYADAAGQLNLFATELEPIGAAAESAAAGMADFAEAIEEVNEPAHQFSQEAQAIVDAQQQAEAEAKKAEAAYQELSRAFEQGAVSAATLKRAEQEMTQAQEAAGQSTQGFIGKLGSMATQYGVTALAGLATVKGLIDLTEAALEAVDIVDDTTTALTMLGGSAEQAASTIEQLRILGDDAALGMPELLTAATRMTAFLGTSKQVPDVLRAVADSAAVMHTSVQAASGGFERIVASGDLSARSLRTLGLTIDDVGKVMGLTGEKIKDAFKGLDDTTKVEVMIKAMDKFKGAAEKMADDTGGAIQRLKNEWSRFLEVLGAALDKVLPAIIHTFAEMIFAVERWVTAWSAAFRAFAEAIKANWELMKFNADAAMTHFRAAQEEWNKGEAALQKMDAAHAKVNATVSEGNRLTEAEIRAQAQAALAREAATKAAKEQATVLEAFVKSAKEFATQLPASYDAYAEALSNGGKTAQSVLSSTEEAIKKAGIAMEGLRGKPLEAMQAVVTKLTEVHDRAKTFAQEDVWNKQAQEIAAFADKYEQELRFVDAATLDFINLAKQAARDVPEAFKKATDASFVDNFLKTMHDLTAEQKKLDDQFQDMARKSSHVMDGYKDGVLEAIPVTKSFADVLTGTGKLFMDMRERMHAASMRTIQDIESETKGYIGLLADMTKLNQPIGQRLELQQKILANEIEMGEKVGANMTAQILGQAKIALQQRVLIDNATLFGDTVVKVGMDAIKAFENMGGAIWQTIKTAQSLGDAFKKVGEQILDTTMTTIINAALKALVDMIIKTVIPAVASTTPAVNTVSASIHAMQVAMHTATAAMIADIQALNAALASLSASMTSAGGSAGAGGGGVDAGGAASTAMTGGPVGVIVAIGQLISSIIGNLQMKAMNKSLDIIVQHTLRQFNVTTEMKDADQVHYEGVYDKLDDIWKVLYQGFDLLIRALGGISNAVLPPFNPGPNFPDVPPMNPSSPTSQSSKIYNSAQRATMSMGGVNIHVYESSNPRETAREIASTLKTISSRFALAGS